MNCDAVIVGRTFTSVLCCFYSAMHFYVSQCVCALINKGTGGFVSSNIGTLIHIRIVCLFSLLNGVFLMILAMIPFNYDDFDDNSAWTSVCLFTVM